MSTQYRVVYELDGKGYAPDKPWVHCDMIYSLSAAMEEYRDCARIMSEREVNIWIEKRSGWERVEPVFTS